MELSYISLKLILKGIIHNITMEYVHIPEYTDNKYARFVLISLLFASFVQIAYFAVPVV